MNDFLAEGLREHGVLGMIWALGHLEGNAEDCFFFAPPLALYRAYPEHHGTPPDAELDICCVVDGAFIIGEVKESDRDINDRLGNDLIAKANDVRPDKVVIACLDRGAEASLVQQAGRVRSAIQNLGCAVETIVPEVTFASNREWLL
jgi:hypothetical protein